MKGLSSLHLLSLTIFLTLFSAPSFAQSFEPLPSKAPVPKNNPMTPAKISLGKQLYFDPRLSKSGTISCNTCHNLSLGGEDNRHVSLGFHAKQGDRSAPTVWNSAFLSSQFWDGRAATLEEQAKGPLTNPVEMAMTNDDFVIERIQKIPGYQKQFKEVFGKDAKIDINHVGQAIAAFERTLITPNSPFDLYLKGNKKAISPAAQRGMKIVQATGCLNCHSGPNFSGPTMPAGTGLFMKFPTFPDAEYEKKYGFNKDPGRFKATGKEPDRGFWRVPTLRNVALTAPYFHNGSVKTLGEAVRVMAKTQLNRTLKDNEVSDIVEFLKTLTGKFPEITLPRLPETIGVNLIEPEVEGTGGSAPDSK